MALTTGDEPACGAELRAQEGLKTTKAILRTPRGSSRSWGVLEAGHAATGRRSNQVRAVVVRTPGGERIEDLIERTILIQAAKGVLGPWRLVQAAPRDPRRRNRQSASMRVDQKALVGAGRL